MVERINALIGRRMPVAFEKSAVSGGWLTGAPIDGRSRYIVLVMLLILASLIEAKATGCSRPGPRCIPRRSQNGVAEQGALRRR
jgi:hypothetical protein